MSGRRLPRLLVGCVILLLAAERLVAQQPTLELRTSPSVPILRSGAPCTIEVTLLHKSPDLLEGRLELDFRLGSELIVRYRSDEIALAGGKQSFRIMMPAMTVPQPNLWISIYGRFLSKGGSIEFEEQTLNVAAEWKRSFVIAVCRERRGDKDKIDEETLQADNTRANYLQLERFQPNDAPRGDLATLVTDISPEMFPTTPVGYFSYDMLFLADRGFDLLREKQFEAIVSWVQAGGSLCVMPHASMSPDQVQFLNSLLGTDASAPAFSRADDGRTSALKFSDETILVKHRLGLGRILLILKTVEPKSFADTSQWRDATAFLWKVRREQYPFVLQKKRWTWGIKSENEQERQNQLLQQWSLQSNYPQSPQYQDEIHPLAPQRMAQANSLEKLLMPEEVSRLPFPLVLSILTAFLLAVGPLDYYVLGFFRKRKYTWILFATVSLSFTAVTVVVAQRYMGDQDYRRGLVIHDIGEDGHSLRKTRFELLFTATSKQLTTDMRNTTFTPADRYLQPNENFDRSAQMRSSTLPRNDEDVAIHLGRVPATYTILQPMRQWSPTISRTTTLNVDDFESPFDFSKVTIDSTENQSDREQITKRIVSAFGPETEVYWKQPVDRTKNRDLQRDLSFRNVPKQLDLSSYVLNLSDRAPIGLFNVISQFSPTGESLEDLAVLDNSDHKQRLLIVITRSGDDVVCYRKLLVAQERVAGMSD